MAPQTTAELLEVWRSSQRASDAAHRVADAAREAAQAVALAADAARRVCRERWVVSRGVGCRNIGCQGRLFRETAPPFGRRRSVDSARGIRPLEHRKPSRPNATTPGDCSARADDDPERAVVDDEAGVAPGGVQPALAGRFAPNTCGTSSTLMPMRSMIVKAARTSPYSTAPVCSVDSSANSLRNRRVASALKFCGSDASPDATRCAAVLMLPRLRSQVAFAW